MKSITSASDIASLKEMWSDTDFQQECEKVVKTFLLQIGETNTSNLTSLVVAMLVLQALYNIKTRSLVQNAVHDNRFLHEAVGLQIYCQAVQNPTFKTPERYVDLLDTFYALNEKNLVEKRAFPRNLSNIVLS